MLAEEERMGSNDRDLRIDYLRGHSDEEKQMMPSPVMHLIQRVTDISLHN